MDNRLLAFILFLCLFLTVKTGFSQCDARFAMPLSQRPANYNIKLTLDDARKLVDATQTVQFTNHSQVPIASLKFYMYFNAFKNTESTFLRGAEKIFGQSFIHRTADEWGWIEVQKITRSGSNVGLKKKYWPGEWGNEQDQSVLEVTLDKPILPNETTVFDLKWHAKIPKTIARSGYSQDFYLMCHWFPQLGVFEKNVAGNWDWNCHQFNRRNEFYADFGNYDVEITAADKFVMGASGCLVSEKNNQNGTTTRLFHVEDVIDFAWSIYPKFLVQEDRWKHVQIRLLLPPEHENLGVRYRNALKFALEYLEKHVGKYPYASITVIDPPFHGLRSGLMEYPTLVTTGTFYGIPENLRLPESLVVHEFAHQYFMQMVASNEKEEPWLDEGFVTYFEDRIIDAQFGEKQALVNIFGYKFDNKELSRLEYTTMQNPRENAPARPGWEFNDHNFKSLIYSKTATALRTVEQLVGTAKMDDLIQTYFERWKFKHPRGTDFLAVLKEKMATEKDTVFGKNVVDLFQKSVFGTAVLDYSVKHISNEMLPEPQGIFGDDSTGGFLYKNGGGLTKLLAKVEIERKGDFVFPVEILVTFEDGSSQTRFWSGEEGVKTFEFSTGSKIVSAQIDPAQKISLDIDINNNSLTLNPDTISMWKYAAKAVFWVQNILQTISFLS
jgi:Peptidase family M1 domain